MPNNDRLITLGNLESFKIKNDAATNSKLSEKADSNTVYTKSEVDSKDTSIRSEIGAINAKIPAAASSSNLLADREYVSGQISSNAAYYLTKDEYGTPFGTKAELFAASVFYCGGQAKEPTRNDYCIVRSDESQANATTRYIYQGHGQSYQWEYQYTVNETPLTQDQLAALNSGINANLVANIAHNANDIIALNENKQDTLINQQNIKSVAGKSLVGAGNVELAKADVGLGNVDNTADADKPISTATQAALDAKQGTLVSGENIKTINGASILGSGDMPLPVDAALSDASTNPVQNKAVTAALAGKVSVVSGKGLSSNDYTNDDKSKLSGIEAGAQVNAVNEVNGKTGDVVITKGDLDLGNVDNTSDADKPISTAVQAALSSKVDSVAGKGLSANDYTDAEKTKLAGIEAGAQVNAVMSVAGKTGAVKLAKGDVNLGNVDNTSDADKPVSTATQAALDGKVDVVSGKGLSTNDFTDAYKDNVDANTTARHAHANKAILDATTASYTAAEQTKLANIEAGAQVNTVSKVNNKTGDVTITKGDLILGNVDNTSDLDKPISTATQAALDAKQSTLVSGTNIKTINNESLLGSGNIKVSAGSIYTFDVADATEETLDGFQGYTWDITEAQLNELADEDADSVTVEILTPQTEEITGHYLYHRDYCMVAGAFTAAMFVSLDASASVRGVLAVATRLMAYFRLGQPKLRLDLLGEIASDPVKTINGTAPTEGGISLKTINGNQIVGEGDITIQAGVTSVAGHTGAVTLADMGLDNVDNKSEATIKEDFTGAVASGNTGFAVGGDVKTYVDGAIGSAITELPKAMIFRGTLGTGGTISSLPAASASTEGDTYKVITAGTYASQAAKVGDVFVCSMPTGASEYSWILIPAGDDIEDTWRQINVNGAALLSTGISSGVVNFKNGSNVTITGSGNDITISAASDTNQTIKGDGTAFGVNDVINIVGGGATTVTADTTDKKITISTPVVTDTNQKVKAGSVAFDVNDTVNFEGGGIVSVTGDATNDKITISASHQSIKTLDTTATTAQSTSASEAIAGSGKITLHKVAKTGTYSDLIGTPAINDGMLSIKGNGTTAATFSANQSGDSSLNIVGGGATTVTSYAANGKLTISSVDTGATSVAVSGSGNAVSAASYDASTRKITLIKGVTALTGHQTIKALKTDNTTAQATSSSETIAGSGTINLHKVAKTGNYGDLIDKPSINNGTLTIKGSGTDVTTFSANQSSDSSLNIVGSGLTSVNADPENGKITISSVGDGNDNDNQTVGVRAGTDTTLTFEKNATVAFVAGNATTIAADITNRTITIGSKYTLAYNSDTGVLDVTISS